ncbi:MAG: polysaccharide pyruvyl transferase family protein [Gammaproteobacteria bacterium]|nr:MAG: polysaccharide pyruvyl transferase family protein [Gammaproteobacteria bacterium]
MNQAGCMFTAGILDTSTASTNSGDQIIMDAAACVIEEVFAHYRQLRFFSHERLSSHSFRLQKLVDFNIACGTNLLHSHMGLVKQWNIRIADAFFLKPVILLGVGWRSQAKRKTDIYTRWLLGRILSSRYSHSVRDSYSESRLRDAGFNNVLNTGCPTIWKLDNNHCNQIPERKGKHAVVVLTDYSQSRERDSKLMEFVLEKYEKVYFWGQGIHDRQYLHTLGYLHKVEELPPTLKAYTALLADRDLSLDYIGTRLHGGIRALQHRRRSIIVGVDHRANSMAKDFNLPVIDRYGDITFLEQRITEDFPTDIHLPTEQIRIWCEQFQTT